MSKRWISLLLALCMVVSILPVQAFAAGAQGGTADPQNPFQDVPEDSWYYEDVVYVYANRLFVGVTDTAFAPGDRMSRAMFVTVLGRMAGVKPKDYRGGGAFSDVAAGAYYAPYVSWAVKYGITTGTGGGRFSPDAPVTRQEMATFFARYFEAFDVDYGADVTSGSPKDLDKAAHWAVDAVEKLWRAGLIEGDGVNFDPERPTTRAEAAAICRRADDAVDTWYCEPGTASERERTDPFAKPSGGGGGGGGGYVSNSYSVAFYDGSRRIDTLYTAKNEPLGKVPAVEKSSKEGAILLGYYTDREFTEPFYAGEPVTRNMRVYAKYQEMDSNEELNFTAFTQMDQRPDLSFRIRRVSGSVAPENAAVLAVKDGSEPVRLNIVAANSQAPADDPASGAGGDGAQEPGEPAAPEPVCTVSAVGGFREGSSYELTLAEGWIFDGKPETIRTASFSIYKDEVDNIRMGRDVKYLEDTGEINYTVGGKTYDVLTSNLVTEGGGSFTYDGNPALERDDILCVYVGTHPNERNSKEGRALLDPAVYVKVSNVSGGAVRFQPLEADDQLKLYDVPDNFPLLLDALPAGGNGSANIGALDISMYENMMGRDDGNLAYAKEHINVGDFVTLYAGEIRSEADVYFGEITGYDAATGALTYTRTTRQAILDSMELYQHIDLAGEDLVTPEQQQELVREVQRDLDNSGFGEQAASLLADLVTSTDQFRSDQTLQEFLAAGVDRAMAANAGDAAMLAARDGLTLDGETVRVTARLVTSGGDLHFNGGIQLALDVAAKFNAPIGNSLGNTLSIDLAATFVEEIAIRPTVKGGLVYKEILGFIPVPIGVEVGASIDVKNYTALSFDAEISTHDNSGILYSTSIVSDLEDMMRASDSTGLSEEYQSSLEALMAKYSELLFQETDWITLVEQDFIKGAEVGIYAVGIGLSGAFVVKTDMSIAIGSDLEYEMGKRYNFWFKLGLFKPTAGSSTMDLIDESFAFRFYVMGKLGVRAGVKLMLYVQVGCGKLAQVGVSVDLGPYVKLYGFFIYEVSKYRPLGSNRWDYKEQMAGALFLEFGLYVTLSFEAEALTFFEYSYEFLDDEFPLKTAGDEKYFYGFSYKPMEDESVVIRDDDRNAENGVAMKLPDRVRELSYMTLNTGMRGSMPLPLDRYHFTVSNPNFTYDAATGVVSVTVPEDTHFMECDLTVTYLHGKMAFSTYDMSVTVPLVWTDLSDRELNEYFTACVRVGNDTDGYETVWSKKILRGQAFDLPTSDEVQALINYNSAKYAGVSGYPSGQQLEGLTINTDTMYDYKVEYQTYDLTVNGIQNPDGSTRSQTFTARYGQAFDFSALAGTGTDIPGQTYTKFANVTAGGVNLSRPINGAMAEWLSRSGTATANYVDDSVTAVFTFSGITHEDVTVKGRKGAVPNTAEVARAVEDIGNTDTTVGIKEITPALGPIGHSANYIVTCVELTGERADLSFDRNFGREDAQGSDTPESLSKLVGGLIVNLPEATRVGYAFDGWYTAPEGGQPAAARTVPAQGITLYAHWTPNQYALDFRANGGQGAPDSVAVTYDSPYGELPRPTPRSGERFVGWWTTEDDSGIRIGDADTVKITEPQTLYAHYKPLVQIKPEWVLFGGREEFVYEKGVVRAADYEFNTSDPTMAGGEAGESIPFPTDGFSLVYVPTQGGLGISTEEPVNAGTFKVRVTRPADELYAAFDAEYDNVLFIDRARRDLSAARPDAASSIVGFNYLSVGTTVDDLGPGAQVSFSMTLNGQEGISTGDGKCFFYDLSNSTGYTAALTYVSVKDDPNYYDASGSVNASMDISTTAVPSYTPEGDTSWFTGASGYTLTTASQMFGFARLLREGESFTGKTIRLGADVDLSGGIWNSWHDTTGDKPGFCGTFDGQGYRIYGLYNPAGVKTVGMFKRLQNGSRVQNVLLAGGYVLGSENVGAITGFVDNGAVIANCTSFAAVRAEGANETDAGGIAGQVSTDGNDHGGGTIINCVNYGRVSGSGYHTGGIVGYQLGSSVIANCANYGHVTGGSDCVGGIAGENYNKNSRVYNCVNGGTVDGSDHYRGAIVGRNNEDDGAVDQGYYLAGSAPGRTATGTKNGANGDGDKVKCSAFSSYSGSPDRVVEDNCSSSMSLMQVLDHWVSRCGPEYSSWRWYNDVLIPSSAPRL